MNIKTDVNKKDDILEINYRMDNFEHLLDHLNKAFESLIEKIDKMKQPPEIRNILYIIATTIVITSSIIGGVLWLIDSRTAEYNSKLNGAYEEIRKLDKSLNAVRNDQYIITNTMGVIRDKVQNNKDFVDQYMYVDKMPTKLGIIQEKLRRICEERENRHQGKDGN